MNVVKYPVKIEKDNDLSVMKSIKRGYGNIQF